MKHLLFDTETTGLIDNSGRPIHKQPHVIEFFGMILDDEKEFEEISNLTVLVKPPITIPEIVTKITTITNEMVSEERTFQQAQPIISEFIGSADVIVAHNLKYDLQVLGFEFQRLNIEPVFPRRQICTVKATEHLKGFRLKLANLHEHLFGEGFPDAHRAEPDVRAMARCYVELKKRGEL